MFIIELFCYIFRLNCYNFKFYRWMVGGNWELWKTKCNRKIWTTGSYYNGAVVLLDGHYFELDECLLMESWG